MSLIDTNENEKRRARENRGVFGKILIGIAFCAVVLLACFVVYVMGLSTGVPSSREGQIATQLAAWEETEVTEETVTQTPETTEPESTTEEPTEPEPTLSPYEEMALTLMDEMTLEEKLWQMIFVTPDELTDTIGPTIAGNGTREALETYPVGGLIYFGDHMISADQIAAMVGNSQSYSKIPLFIGVDEEGGKVSRLSNIGVVPKTDPMETYGVSGNELTVYDLGTTFAQGLLEVGFNVDFAPVADVITNPDNTELSTRTFGDDPEIAGAMVAQMVKGLQDGNVISCLKHFPGHGSTSADSHNGKSVSERTLEDLRATEFIPFTAGIEAGADMVMISHMSLPNVTGNEEPCDFSYTVVTELLRQELGFKGLVITDSHEMGAVTNDYECGEAAVLAVQAGCDIVLMPESKTEAFKALLTAVEEGTLTEERINESVLRILSLKYKYGIITDENETTTPDAE